MNAVKEKQSNLGKKENDEMSIRNRNDGQIIMKSVTESEEMIQPNITSPNHNLIKIQVVKNEKKQVEKKNPSSQHFVLFKSHHHQSYFFLYVNVIVRILLFIFIIRAAINPNSTYQDIWELVPIGIIVTFGSFYIDSKWLAPFPCHEIVYSARRSFLIIAMASPCSPFIPFGVNTIILTIMRTVKSSMIWSLALIGYAILIASLIWFVENLMKRSCHWRFKQFSTPGILFASEVLTFFVFVNVILGDLTSFKFWGNILLSMILIW